MKRMMSPAAILLFGACLGTSSLVNAAQFVIQSDLTWFTDDNGQNVAYTIDRVDFEVTSESTVTLDILSVGAFPIPIDSEIRVAINDGAIDVIDFFAVNDDGQLGDDGSIFTVDSWFSDTFAAGSYSVFIGGCCFSAQDAIDGLRVVSASTGPLTPGDLYGTYQLTMTGDIAPSPVPLPPAFGFYLVSIGLVSAIARSGKKRYPRNR